MKNVVLIDAVRTAWGKPGAGLAPFISSDFSAKILTALLERTGVDALAVDQVVFGQALPSTMPNNIGHYAWLKAELPVDVPGVTVQSCTGSALQALRSCYYLIATGNENVCVAGGADSYSAAPFALRDARNHFYPQHRTFIDTIEESEMCTQPEPMGRLEQYELVHGKELSAQAVEFAKQSIAKAQAADNAAQIHPISYEVRKKGTVTVDQDEWLKTPQDTEAALAPYADGAAVAMLMSEEKAQELGLTPMAQLQGFAVAGCDPKQMQTSGAMAVQKLLKNKGLTMEDIAVVEVIENSAQDVIDTMAVLGGNAKVNPMGGALAYGKNDGAEGIAMLMRLVNSLEKGQKGIVCVYSAGGQGMATLVQK